MKNGDYILIVAPEDYPGRKYRNRYIYEHHSIWWKTTGQIIPRGYILHHKNHNKHDNRIENLELMTAGTHSYLHNFKNKKIPLVCAYCRKSFQRSPNHVNYKKAHGQKNFFCSRSHCYQAQIKKAA